MIADAGVERIKPEGKIVWHSWRHVFGTRLRKRTDVETLRQLMGHRDITTTQQYLDSEEKDRRRAVEEDAV